MSLQRMDRVRTRMAELDIDALLLSTGAELPWLIGYRAVPLERLTMLVVRPDTKANLIVPLVEAASVRADANVFDITPCGDGHNPIEIAAKLIGGAHNVAVSDKTWSKFTLQLQQLAPLARWISATAVISPLREVKERDEIAALTAAAAAADSVASQLLNGDVRLIGRTEKAVSDEISMRLTAVGLLDRVDFADVGSGPNGASPHHNPGDRVIQPNEPVVCDFGGPMNQYFADITRTVFTGEPTAEMREVYEAVRVAQENGVQAATVGTPACDVDRAARGVIEDAGYGEYFIHRLGHGIGFEVHEEPYMAVNNPLPVLAGNTFSIEPGVYLPGKFGVRIEDIVIAADDGPKRLNNADHALTIVET